MTDNILINFSINFAPPPLVPLTRLAVGHQKPYGFGGGVERKIRQRKPPTLDVWLAHPRGSERGVGVGRLIELSQYVAV